MVNARHLSLVVVLALPALSSPATAARSRSGVQTPADPSSVREVAEEVRTLRMALERLRAIPDDEQTGAKRGRAQRVERALSTRLHLLRHARPRPAVIERARADREDRDLYLALNLAAELARGAVPPPDPVRELARRWSALAREARARKQEPQGRGTPAEERPAAGPTEHLDELAVRAWILRLACGACAGERAALVLESALRCADLQLADAPWSEQAVARSMVASPERLARAVDEAAASFAADGEAERARICRRLAGFYRGDAPEEEPDEPRTEAPQLDPRDEARLRALIAAREAHRIAGRTALAERLDRSLRAVRRGAPVTDELPSVAGPLARAAELLAGQGHPRLAETLRALLRELPDPEAQLEDLRRRVQHLERELARLRRRG